MPWSGSTGSQTYSRTNGVHTGSTVWQQDAAATIGIRADYHDVADQDIATALNVALLQTGGTSMQSGAQLRCDPGSSSSAPGITFTGDLTTGFYRPGAGIIDIRAANGLRFNGNNVMLESLATKTIASASATLTTGASPVTLFTVTGDVLASVFATVQTGLTSTSATGTLEVGVSGALAAFLLQVTVNGSNLVTGTVWGGRSNGPIYKADTVYNAGGFNNPGTYPLVLVGSSANIICTIGTNSMTAGALTFYCIWKPLSSGSSVVAA